MRALNEFSPVALLSSPDFGCCYLDNNHLASVLVLAKLLSEVVCQDCVRMPMSCPHAANGDFVAHFQRKAVHVSNHATCH